MRKLAICLALVLPCLPFVTAKAQTATPSPAEQEKRVEQLLSQMTVEERVDILAGSFNMGTQPIPRLHIPIFQMADGPVGAHVPPPSTAFAAGIGLAATWDTQLAEEVGVELGRDARSRGAAYLLGPGVNIYRAPMNGRNFEYFGEDPYLSGRIATAYIQGVQSQHVSAVIKHYLANNSEYARDDSNSIVDERALREIYLPVFEAGVKEGHVGSVMDSYNLINGAHATQNNYFNSEVLKRQWEFDGVLMSDWGAVHDTVACFNAGLDLEMPDNKFFNRASLLPALKDGKVSTADLDDKVRRILRVAVRFGWLDREQMDIAIPRYNQIGRLIALRGALESAVLLKNDHNLLPLDRTKQTRIAVLGPNAWPTPTTGGGSGEVLPFTRVSILEGISNSLGIAGNVTYARAIPSIDFVAHSTRWTTDAACKLPGVTVETFADASFSGQPANTRVEQSLEAGEHRTIDIEKEEADLHPSAAELAKEHHPHPPRKTDFIRWTGYYAADTAGSYDIYALDGAKFRLLIDNKPLIDNSQSNRATLNQASLELSAGTHKVVFEQLSAGGYGHSDIRVGIVADNAWVSDYAKKLAAQADVVVLALGFDPQTETEGADRSFDLPLGQQHLIREISAINKNVVVVLNSGGSVDVARWLENVPALLQTWYPGEEGGDALASLLFGDMSPSGRLPISWERRIEDNPSIASYYPTAATVGSAQPDIAYNDGVWVGYRGYDHNHTPPLFPFGFGLSYATFEYSNLSVKPAADPTGRTLFTVGFDVKNASTRDAAEVAQLYVAPPAGQIERPEKELKGFARLELKPGETRHVELPLNPRAFTYFDVAGKQWHADAGQYTVRVGHSSADTPLHSTATLDKPIRQSIEASRP
jgi:beta-glucosidase